VSPDDVKALYAYFMHGVAPVEQANKANGITWPLSMRWPLSVWRKMFSPAPVDTPAPAPADSGDAAMLRGKYLVEGLGHCSACHTPRGVALQEKAMSAADGTDFLSGGMVDGWLAGNLRGDSADGLGSWSKADLVAFLKTGRNAHSAAFGGMSDVVAESTQYMSDSDLNAIAAYLKSLPPKDAAANQPPAYNNRVGQELLAGHAASIPGAMDFLNNCAACHRATGRGYAETFPTLAQNPAVNSADPQSLIHIILKGAQMPGTHAAPTRYAMPAFDWRLTDQEVADIATFVRSSWGNNAPDVAASDVAKVRKEVGAAAAPVR
jgi:mono/diheme cytochrome c family protein